MTEHKTNIKMNHIDLEPRVANLETNLAGLTEQVTNIGKNLDRIINSNQKDHEETRKEIRELSRSFSAAGKTNWNVIFAGLSIAITLAGGLIWHTVATIAPIDHRLERVDNEMTARMSQLKQDYYDFGKNAAHIEMNSKNADYLRVNLDALLQNFARLDGKVTEVNTRRWIDIKQNGE
jgi:uncharacterized coiled-coil protein SlyX